MIPKTKQTEVQTTRRAKREKDPLEAYRNLYHRSERDRTGLYLLEGMRHLALAVKNNAPLEHLIISQDLLQHPFARKLARDAQQRGTPCSNVGTATYLEFAQAEESPGVIAVVRQQWEDLERIRPGRGLCWLAAEAVQAPGNLGTIIRTSEGVGGSGVVCIGEEGDPYDPAAVRASMGALYAQKFVRTTLEKFATWKRHHQFALIGTSPSARDDYHEIEYPKPTMFLLGCEKRGLSAEIQTLCDRMVRIPMAGQTDSLNVAIATSVLLYELFNQRRDERRK